MIRNVMTTKRDLRNWVDSAIGADGTAEITDAVTDWLQAQDHPAWGDDWTDWLAEQDLWHIATGLGV
jgi:hypothetical protein